MGYFITNMKTKTITIKGSMIATVDENCLKIRKMLKAINESTPVKMVPASTQNINEDY